jgi:DNA-binding LacI/PurR family transcriptional regulator
MILPNVPLAEESTVLNHLLRDIQRSLVASGHTVDIAAKTQTDLRFAPSRLGRFLAATPADGWIVPAAPRSVLEFFAAQPVPAMAIGGRSLGLQIASAGLDGTPALCAATRRLVELGHRRIVLICGREWRQPSGGRSGVAYTAELSRHGIEADVYHIPDFEPTPAGLHALFTSLFRVTPPTALILESADYAIAALAFLAQRELSVPRDVSLVCLYSDTTMRWCHPPLARLRYDDKVVSRRVIRWCRALARGQVDRESVLFPAEFDEGGTIGAVRLNSADRGAVLEF